MPTLPALAGAPRNEYPCSDGKPMAETDWHRELMLQLIEALRWHFARRPRVYVSGNLLIHYEQGNRRRHVAPDVFVVKGVPNHNRPNYLLWDEGHAPQFVLELTSASTRHEDLRTKFRLYQDVLKVREYFLFDPRGDYLDPPLRGYRLHNGTYRPIRPTAEGALRSQVIGLHLRRDGDALRLIDSATGLPLPTVTERVQIAEARLEQMQAELAALRRRQTNGRNGV